MRNRWYQTRERSRANTERGRGAKEKDVRIGMDGDCAEYGWG
jgi:hypothetical protein